MNRIKITNQMESTESLESKISELLLYCKLKDSHDYRSRLIVMVSNIFLCLQRKFFPTRLFSIRLNIVRVVLEKHHPFFLLAKFNTRPKTIQLKVNIAICTNIRKNSTMIIL